MVIRLLSAALWFLAIGWGLNLVSAFTDLPQGIGFAIGAAAGAVIAINPRGIHREASVPAVVAGSTSRGELTPVSQAGR